MTTVKATAWVEDADGTERGVAVSGTYSWLEGWFDVNAADETMGEDDAIFWLELELQSLVACDRGYETRGMLAGAYAGRGARRSAGNLNRVTRTHVVALDADGAETRVLCGARLDSIADACGYDDAELSAEATCATCAKRDPRRV